MKLAKEFLRFPRYPRLRTIIFPSILVLSATFATIPAFAQSSGTDSPTSEGAATLQARIERARALAAAHQLSAAVAELDALRTSASDDSIRNVASLMLMSICMEEGNYARAESLLEETFKTRQARKDSSIRTYFALAGQAVNGARAHLTRYRNFGINVADASLPRESLADLDRLRALLERMSFQAREISKDQPKAYESLALLEDILGIRLSLARDDEDRARWEGERAGVRQGLVLNQSQVASLGSVPPVTAVLQNSTQANPSNPTAVSSTEPSNAIPNDENPSAPDTVSTGILNMRATRRIVPVYPQIARNAAAEGIVRVYVTVDERGNVSEIAKSEGHTLLRGAAEDAAIEFNFTL